jgi:hypothetical protein
LDQTVRVWDISGNILKLIKINHKM